MKGKGSKTRNTNQQDALSQEYEEAISGNLEGSQESSDAAQGDELEDLLFRNSITIEPVTEIMRRGRPDEISVIAGYQLVMVGPKGKLYAGRTLRWSPISCNGMHFDTEEQARAAAVSYARTLEVFYDVPDANLGRVQLDVPLVTDPVSIEYRSRLQILLTVDEVRKLTAIRLALRQLNVTIGPEGPVNTNNDVIRWLLRSIVIP